MYKARELTEEKVSEKFDLSTFFEARDLAIQIVQESAKLIEVGMSEKDGIEIIERKMSDYGVQKKWHPTKFRFGKNTLCSFKEVSDTSLTIQKEDIFFFDIGPVFKEHEADFGETFTIGNQQENFHLQNSVKEIFHACKTVWKENKLTGKELYHFAQESAKSKNCILNMNMKGHRLGDFPHHIFHRGNLEDFSETPAPNLWVLEILISNKNGTKGAFFEDIIY